MGRLESKGGGGGLMDCGQAGERQKSPCFRSDRLASMCIRGKRAALIFRLLDGKQVSTMETNHELKEGKQERLLKYTRTSTNQEEQSYHCCGNNNLVFK